MTRDKPPAQPPFDRHCDHCGETPSGRDGKVLRCACGSLLARHVSGGLELKCRRCKRTLIVPVEAREASSG